MPAYEPKSGIFCTHNHLLKSDIQARMYILEGTDISAMEMQPSEGHATQRGTYFPSRDVHPGGDSLNEGHITCEGCIFQQEIPNL
ncbi:hypothetical protein C0J52_07910 [Blattella germanica]|nr:hypothetical protein C0J52_07910 [Blattella germanica]